MTEANTAVAEHPPAKPPRISSARWFVIGLFFFGLLIGYLLFNSKSPVVGIALPLIFGLVGGAGGIYVVLADITSAETQPRLRLIGQSLAAFSIGLIAGTEGAVTYNKTISQHDAHVHEVALPSSAGLSADDLVRLGQIRVRLQMLHMSGDEQRKAMDKEAVSLEMKKAPGTNCDSPKKSGDDVAALRDVQGNARHAAQLIAAITSGGQALDAEGAAASRDNEAGLIYLQATLVQLVGVLPKANTPPRDSNGYDDTLVSGALHGVQVQLNDVLGDYQHDGKRGVQYQPPQTSLVAFPSLLGALIALRFSVDAYLDRQDPCQLSSDLLNSADDLPTSVPDTIQMPDSNATDAMPRNYRDYDSKHFCDTKHCPRKPQGDSER